MKGIGVLFGIFIDFRWVEFGLDGFILEIIRGFVKMMLNTESSESV